MRSAKTIIPFNYKNNLHKFYFLMVVKTITCHNVYNHGASLQEYALLEVLKKLGHDSEAINYQPSYLADNYRLFGIPNPKWQKNVITKFLYILAKLPERVNNIPRYKKFDDFSKTYIKSTKKLYKNNEELKKNLPFADAFICGSDQIWNAQFQNGKDPAFYLDFVPDDKLKVSYAASLIINKINNSHLDFVEKAVKRINFVSVRENSGAIILNNLYINNVYHVLDPVFLIDKDIWKNNFVTPMTKKFVLIYDFDNNLFLKKQAIEYAKKHKLKIFALTKKTIYADKIFWKISPVDFVNLIANASMVFTNSFHAIAFSLIFEKQFFAVRRRENINTRIEDLLSDLNIVYRLIDEDSGEIQKINLIDFNKVCAVINKRKEESINFIKNSLNAKI